MGVVSLGMAITFNVSGSDGSVLELDISRDVEDGVVKRPVVELAPLEIALHTFPENFEKSLNSSLKSMVVFAGFVVQVPGTVSVHTVIATALSSTQ
jgi:hypothetical protein